MGRSYLEMEDDNIAMATAFSLVNLLIPRLHSLALLTVEQSSKVTKCYLNGSTRMHGKCIWPGNKG